MNALKREMERKRKALQEARQQSGSASGFVKAVDLRRVEDERREADRHQQQQQAKRPRHNEPKGGGSNNQETLSSKKSRKEDSVQRKQPPQSKPLKDDDNNNTTADGNNAKRSQPDPVSAAAETTPTISSADITQQLRQLGLPVRLFGEVNAKRLIRLQEAQQGQLTHLQGQSERQEFALEQGHRIHNPFLAQDQKASSTTGAASASSEMIMNKHNHKARSKNDIDASQYTVEDEKKDDHIKVLRYFHSVLVQWEQTLEARPNAVKTTVAGKKETNTARQCRDYIQPLFRACQQGQLEANMLTHLANIVDFAKQGEFVQAHDEYMNVAIGRAAWPIGVTMVKKHTLM